YELFDWQYAQAEKDIMNLEKEIKSLDNTDCLLSDRSKTSIGRVMAFVLKNKKNVPNVQTNKDKAQYAQSIGSIDHKKLEKIPSLTASLHDIFMATLNPLGRSGYRNLSYSHMPLITKLYGNKKYDTYDTYNYGETNGMQLFNVDYAAFNHLEKNRHQFYFNKTNVPFSKSILSKLYDIEFQNNNTEILLYQKGHTLRDWARRIRNGIIGVSCYVPLALFTAYLWNKIPEWKENQYSADIQKQYAAFADKSTFDFCIHNWKSFTGSSLPSYITSLAADSNTMPSSNDSIKQCCAIINNNQHLIHPIIPILAYSGMGIFGLSAFLMAVCAGMLLEGNNDIIEWKEKPLAVINIRSDQLCE
ncbi:MAG TPA: hypothetical protein VGW78_04490, partial [Candidatus Babeliales bacterium]|nr:hypothetical protein [Candidatus Babeliales bacterium]